MAELERAGAITDNGLNVNGKDLSREQCEALASLFGEVKRRSSWVIGDLMVYCENAFGTDVTYGEIAELTGLAYQTVTNLASVSRRVPPSRRRASLPHSMHETVASLPPVEQKQLLKQAEAEAWTRLDLRERVHPRVLEPAVPNHVTDTRSLEKAARDLLAHADDAGENVVCRKLDVDRVRAALGA